MRYVFLVLIISSCVSKPKVDGFDADAWKKSEVCSNERIEGASLLERNEADLIGYIQKDIEALLGKTPEHILAKRSEQFFYYPITENCGDGTKNTSLSFRFDALGRVKEVLVILDTD